MLPYGKQTIDEADIQAVVDVLRSDWLTTGPIVDQFEEAFSNYTNAYSATSVCNGTAALQTAMHALGIQASDEVIVPALTFCATSNAVLYQGGTPVFADVSADTLLIDVDDVANKITPKTKAIIAMDYAGQPCDYQSLRHLADTFGLLLVADACHSLGATYREQPVGGLADLNCFSFHPVKPLTSGEGGMITVNTADSKRAQQLTQDLRAFRNHGIQSDHRSRHRTGQFEYDMTQLGFNLRLTDIQCALGMSQLSKLDSFTKRRQEIAAEYGHQLKGLTAYKPLTQLAHRTHAYHLMVIRCQSDRNRVFQELRHRGISANVHYRPVYQHSFYRARFETHSAQCPIAEQAYQEILSLPIFPELTNQQIEFVNQSLAEIALGTPISA